MSSSVRLNEVRFTMGRIRCRVIAFGRANSRSPSAPWIRPKPESPEPPNGSDGTLAKEMTELIAVIPLRSALAAAMAAFRFLANTVPPRPYRLALARSTPSARSATLVTVIVGPKVSSVTALLSSGTSARMTGPT